MDRRSLLESLEHRHLMAGPNLIGIQQNPSELLVDGAQLTSSPRELVFKFDEDVRLTNNDLQGIQVTRGGSGLPARALTDLGSNGAFQLEFRSKRDGAAGNGVVVEFNSTARSTTAPIITVVTDNPLTTNIVEPTKITITLNSDPTRFTQVREVISALTAHPVAKNLIDVTSVSGSTATAIDTRKIAVPVLTLRGAGTASAESDLGTNRAVNVRFIAAFPGADGQNVKVVLQRVNVGQAAAPLVLVNGTTVTVRLNSTPGNETTVAQLFAAINNSVEATRLVIPVLELGSLNTVIGNLAGAAQTIALANFLDTSIKPGYLGFGNSNSEIVFRFSEPLPSDSYRIDIFGSGPAAIKSVLGDAFNDGQSISQAFTLDLAPQVLAVVPEPIRRNSLTGALSPEIGVVEVYFNEDDLDVASAKDPRFYQLIFTRDTLDPADDVTIYPTRFGKLGDPTTTTSGQQTVDYDPSSNIVRLTFPDPLGRSRDPISGTILTGAARLRIGNAQTKAASPTTVPVGIEPGDSEASAFRVTPDLRPDPETGVTSVRLTGSIDNQADFGLNFPGAGAAGTRNVRPEDAGRDNRTVPLGAFRGSADSKNGISTIRYNFPTSFKGDNPNLSGEDISQTYFNLISSQQKTRVREVLSLFSQYLGVQFIEDERAAANSGAFQFVVGDLYGADIRAKSEPGGIAVATRDTDNDHLVVMDFQDFEQSDDDLFGAEFFRGASLAVGQLLGYGSGDGLPGSSTQSTSEILERLIGGTLLGNQVDNAEISIESLNVPGGTRITEVQFRQNPTAATPVPVFQVLTNRLIVTLGSSTANNSVNSTKLQDLLDAVAADPLVNRLIAITAVKGLLATGPLPPNRGTNIGTAAPHTVPLVSTTGQRSFPSATDIVNGQYLYRPDSTDIDLYQFTILGEAAKVSIETFAERLTDSSLLNTQLRLYRRNLTTNLLEEIAQNDDYFSNDSLIEVDALQAGTYFLGVSASGNNRYNPNTAGTGFGGLSEGKYDIRITTHAIVTNGIKDNGALKNALDGDADGKPGGVFNFWFVPATVADTIYVDKAATSVGSGTISQPFRNLSSAISSATPGKTIHVLGNGGVDGKVETIVDNFSYEVGFATNGTAFADGSTLDVPQGVQLIIDAGAIFKMRSSRVGVGSTAPLINRSNANIQILGTPTLRDASGFVALDQDGLPVPGSVYFTSTSDLTFGVGSGVAKLNATGSPGDWGGIDLRSDLDFANTDRVNRENQGIFLNYIQFADLKNGGGQVRVDGRSVVVSPVELALTRATVVNSRISRSADAAIAATPDTFVESRFAEPFFQPTTPFVSGVTRVGPEVHGNTVVDNSINGLFVRITTRTGDVLQKLTKQARFDDTDIVHVLTENLTVQGTAGGATVPAAAPSNLAIRGVGAVGGGQVPAGSYSYRLSFASPQSESLASAPSTPITLSALGQVQLSQLPTVQQLPTDEPGEGFTSRRLYRAPVVNGVVGSFLLVAELNGTDTVFVDKVASGSRSLPDPSRLVARLDASLKVDPGTIVKLGGARIDLTFGADLFAEGTDKSNVIITGIDDRRFGASGSFDTRSFDTNPTDALDVKPKPGSWGGIYVGNSSSASIDQALIAGAGGVTRIDGGFASFNAIEVHQGELRLTNSQVEQIADGRGTVNNDDPNRAGRSANASGVIFVRGAQPIVIRNDFVAFEGPALSFDVNSFVWNEVSDYGRSRGVIDAFAATANSGPLIQRNRLDNSASVAERSKSINGLEVRGGQVATEVVWDDVDIVHVVRDMIEVPNQYVYGGLRLQSDARGSLVVKFADIDRVLPVENGEAVLERAAGIVAGGTLVSATSQFVDIADRIGGSLQIIGTPDFPVVLTALTDDTIGAGFSPAGRQAVDSDNNGVLQSVLTSSTVPPLPSASLPLGQEYSRADENGANNLTIDNDVANNVLGYFQVNNVASGASVATVNVTGNDKTVTPSQQLANQNLNFLYETVVDVDNGSGGVRTAHLAPQLLSASTIDVLAQPVVGDPDRVRSEGRLNLFFPGEVADPLLLRWVAETFLFDNRAVMYTTLKFTTTDGLAIGNTRGTILPTVSPRVRVISLLDFNIGGAIDDVLYSQGTPGAADFRAVVLDQGTRVGFSHGGVYAENGIDQINAAYTGWAASVNQFFLNPQNFEGQVFTQAGTLDPMLGPTTDPVFPGSSTASGPADIGTAFAWELDSNDSNATVTNFVELLPSDPTDPDIPQLPRNVVGIGSWDGITIREAANDRNVSVSAEIETRLTDRIDSNSVPSQSQFLGELAPSLDSGDENRRLGFVVNGAILSPGDNDVYSFIGVAGTQVWIDIDKTSSGLDTVVELIDANGVTLALSDNSLSETRGDLARGDSQRLTPDPRFTADKARSLNLLPVAAKSAISAYQDSFSTNARDAGLRLVLPELAGQRNLYHIRVRSSNIKTSSGMTEPGALRDGVTSGTYQLQVRLREADETVGTQIRFGDVRFAANGIQVIGGPTHSPLAGDEYETAGINELIANAQPLGLFSVNQDIALTQNIGPLASDRLAKSVGGVLSGADDTDWYRFDVNYQNLTQGAAGLYLSTIFDIDYADGFARSDVAIYVFNSAGALVLVGGDSNIADDQPTGIAGTSTNNLAQGSAGTRDPFIGAAELAEGNYFVAVVNQSRIPTVLNQFQTAVTLNPLLRLEPIDSITRIAEDHIESVGGGTAGKPTIPMLFNEGGAPSGSLITLLPVLGSGAVPGVGPNSTGTYVYRISYFSATSESAISGGTVEATLSAVGGITLSRLPVIPVDSGFTGRRLYRATIGANGAAGAFLKVAELNATDTTFTDRAATGVGAPPQVSQSVIPYTLNDVVLFSQSGNSIGLRNALTGTSYAGISTQGNGFRDFSIHPNGELFTYTFPNNTVNADLDLAYSYTRIDGETGAATNVGFSGLQTFQDGPIVQGRQTVVDSNDGFQVEGMTYRSNGLGFIVGNRPFNRNIVANGVNGRYFQNILYAFDPQSGRVTGLGTPDRQVRTFGNITIDERANGAGTQIRERGYIETGAGPGITPVLTQLVVPDATRVNAAGGTTVLLDDGDAFSISAGAGSTPFRIELDSGPVLNFVTDSTLGSFPIDGTVFSLTTSTGTQAYELDSGPVIVIDSTQVIDGANVTIRDIAGTTRVFEFDSDGVLANPSAISVPFVLRAQSNLLAQSLATAITGAGFLAKGFATPGQGRVDLTGDSVTVSPVVAGSGLSVEGTAGSSDPNIPGSNVIKIRENFTGDELAQAVAAATGGAVAGNRVNFRNVLTTNISNLTTRNIVTQTGTTGVSVGSSGVRFLVSDTAESIAIRITQVINSTVGIQAAGIAATADRGVVALQGGVLLNNIDPSFSVGGVPPGGRVTGIATIGNSLYAVSDAGGLYVVADPTLDPTLNVSGRIGNYVTTATDLIGLNFSGLSVGPQSVEGGRFANLLFGVTFAGDVYAFDTLGRLQPVFVGGATSINIGPNTTGIDFSTLDYNLFHVSERRAADPGHGIDATDNGARPATSGGSSFYFGAGQNLISGNANSPFAVPRQDGQGVQNTYNFPGGAKGAIESNAFNLSGYSAADLPTLYFNYFLATDGVDGRDAFRVYAITEDGVEHLLATNNLATGPGTTFDDEFDDPTESVRPEIAKQYADDISVAVQPLFDNTNSWRQARVSLGPFAGSKNLRLRVEFSTGASFGDGTLGIHALAGNALADGQTIEISGRTFELDLGASLSVPSGVQIANFYAQLGSTASSRVVAVVGGVTYVLNDGLRIVNAGEVNVELQKNGDRLLSTFTADAVATRLAAAIQTKGVPTTTVPTSFLAEPNDELLSATSLPKVSGNVILTGNGALGTAQDVDLFRFEIPANATIRVGMSPTVPNAFVGNVRLFDSSGNQLKIGTSPAPVEFTSPTAQTIYIGFSSGGNSDYNPSVSASGSAGTAGPYAATVELISDLRVVQTGSRLQITGGFAASGGADGLVVATGAPGTQGIPIALDATMSANQVALELQRAISRQFSSGIASAYPVTGSTITLPGLVVSNAGPFRLAGLRSSDIFGSNGIARSTANNFEGVYVDDFVIGFAERGELVTAAGVAPLPANPTPAQIAANAIAIAAQTAFSLDASPTFTNPPSTNDVTVTGSYQLEIRDASEYVNSSLNNVNANGVVIPSVDSRFRTFDTNERLGSGQSIRVVSSASIVDGASFQISDGVNTITFEFDIEVANGVGDGVTPGRVPVVIPSSRSLNTDGSLKLKPGDDGAGAVAIAMINAINAPAVRSLIDVVAVRSDGVDGAGGNDTINMFGNVTITNFSGAISVSNQVVTLPPEAKIVDGASFRIAQGSNFVVFEFDRETAVGVSNNVVPGRERILIPFFTATTTVKTKNSAVLSAVVAAINAPTVRARLGLNASLSNSPQSIELSGTPLISGNADVSEFVGFTSLNFPSVTSSPRHLRGDENRDRSDQGIILIENSRVAFSESVGIDLNYGQTIVSTGKTGSGTGVTTTDSGFRNTRESSSVVRYPRNLVELNAQRLLPGVVVQSNVLAYNQVSGIEISGLPDSRRLAPNAPIAVSAADTVPFDRILNNTVIGGTLALRPSSPAATFANIEFAGGNISFADRVATYTRGTGLSSVFDDPEQSLGAPDSLRRGLEPIAPRPNQNPADPPVATTSLGRGGVLTVQFVDNFLTGSGDARPDLVIFETGSIESVRVEVSRDNVSFIEVGIVAGTDNQIDIDKDTFGNFSSRLDDRFSFVRITDLREIPSPASVAIGADIDAVGALSTVPTYDYQLGRQGISARDGVAPTLLNNVIANTQTGISIDSRSGLTVVGGSAYFQNAADATTTNLEGSFALKIPETVDIFVDPIGLVFTPRAGVSLIDSSIDSVLDRPSLATVRNAIGLPPSPIIAPRFDVNGQLRVDDPLVDTPSGIGERVFKDRGADDRGDSFGPRVKLVTPFAPESGVASTSSVAIGTVFDFFEIQLVDGIGPSEPSPGVGIDDRSVTANSVLVSRDGVRLVEGLDYRVGYDASNNNLRISPIAGIWENNSTYVVRLLDRKDTLISFGGDALTLTDGRVTELRGSSSAIARLETELGITITIDQENGKIVDGQIITIFDGTQSVNFEISNDALPVTSTRNTLVNVNSTASVAEIAGELAKAINASVLNIKATLPLIDQELEIPTKPVIQLLNAKTGIASTLTAVVRNPNVDASSIFTVTGAIGTQFGFGLKIPADVDPARGNLVSSTVQNGDQFVIARNGNILGTFELTTSGVTATVGAIPVLFVSGSPLDQLANSIVAAILARNFGLTPVNLGEGRIALSGDSSFSVDTSRGVNPGALIAVGAAGQPATTPVKILIGDDKETVIQKYAIAISGLNLAGVTQEVIGDRILLNGVNAVTGAGFVEKLYVQDRVGNILQPNDVGGAKTELTIFVGGGIDFGDAPSRILVPSSNSPFLSSRAEGGPQARIDTGFQFGTTNTAEADAILPNGDDEDGITLAATVAVANTTANFSVDIRDDDKRPFYVDVWVDWNGDGTLQSGDVTRFRSANAPGNSAIISVGVNTLGVSVPSDAKNGKTFARFRLSERVNLGVNETAFDTDGTVSAGEIQDTEIIVQSNPFQNPLARFDVNKSGVVTPLDALNVINLLAIYNRNRLPTDSASIPLNPPPAYMNDIINGRFLPDVNGDGKVSAQDALVVINELARTRRNAAAGEGEQFIPLSNSLLASPLTVATSTTTMKRALAETVEMPSIVDSNPTRMSVFDSPQVVALDDILNNIADDNRETSSSAASATDMVFNGLGLGL